MTAAPDLSEARLAAAAARLDGVVRVTPLLNAAPLDEIAGRPLFVKAECLQITGSFKLRGGWSAVSALAPEVRAKGILACSSGNHAQGVAYAAARHGAPCVIVMPADAPAAKTEGARSLGAEIVPYDRATCPDRDAFGAEIAAERGLTMIPPYDHPEVIAGQATCGAEIARQYTGGPAELLVCCGGGGLSAGIALATEADPRLTVRTCEPAGFDDTARSLAAGTQLANASATGSICDAILSRQPGDLTFPILQRLAGPGLVVTDEECLRAMVLAFRHLKLVLEPGGAAALAAALFHAKEIGTENVIAVATGGNVAPDLFADALARFG